MAQPSTMAQHHAQPLRWTARHHRIVELLVLGCTNNEIAEKLKYTQDFFEKHGPKTIVIARFLPIVRTMAPFVAGFSGMQAKRFLTYNVTGGILWVVSLTVAGYLFGNIPFVKNNLTAVIVLIIFLSILPGIIAYLKARALRKTDEKAGH